MNNVDGYKCTLKVNSYDLNNNIGSIFMDE